MKGAAVVLAILAACSSSNSKPSEATLRPAAQAEFTSFAAGNWGAVWDHFDRASKAIVSRAEYVRRLDACPNPLQGRPVEVGRITDNGDGTWSVELKQAGQLQTLPAKFENGEWVFPLTEAARVNFALPYDQFVKKCGG